MRFLAALAAESAVDRDGKRRDSNAGRCSLQFRIGGQSAAENNVVKIKVCDKSSLFSNIIAFLRSRKHSLRAPSSSRTIEECVV